MKNAQDYSDSQHLYRILMKPENEPARRAYSKIYNALMKCTSALDKIKRRDVSGSLQEEIDEMRRLAKEALEDVSLERE